jgi:hypothetical protein
LAGGPRHGDLHNGLAFLAGVAEALLRERGIIDSSQEWLVASEQSPISDVNAAFEQSLNIVWGLSA